MSLIKHVGMLWHNCEWRLNLIAVCNENNQVTAVTVEAFVEVFSVVSAVYVNSPPWREVR